MAAAMVVSPMAANAQNSRNPSVQPVSMSQTQECEPLRINKAGRELSAGASAWEYSHENPGTIGIAIYPGQDLGEDTPEDVGNWLIEAFSSANVEAKCFIHDEYGPKGTGIDFVVNSSSWMDVENRNLPFGLSEVRNIPRLKSMVAEAKTGGAVLTSAAMSTRDPNLP